MWQVGAGDLPRAKCPVPPQEVQVPYTAGTGGQPGRPESCSLQPRRFSRSSERRKGSWPGATLRPTRKPRKAVPGAENQEGDSEQGREEGQSLSGHLVWVCGRALIRTNPPGALLSWASPAPTLPSDPWWRPPQVRPEKLPHHLTGPLGKP